MSVDRTHVAENDVERERMSSLVARLSDEALSKRMPADWTVSAVLAHISFWDARVIFLVDRWKDGIEPSTADYEPEDIDWINDSGTPLPSAAAA